ncbi:MAG: RelA/SpoT protein [Cenarchaeum symbiont of Oopsacas minuta]|nr:RelA/SpoT protein [Cenarchaeum symbiont of Oopsacas minuta]
MSEHPKHSKNKINRAGLWLTDEHTSSQDIVNAIKILNEWRTLHINTLDLFKRKLDELSTNLRINTKTSTVYRLKRRFSIINKLKRSYAENGEHMKLTRMQDIAGCRLVLADLELMNQMRCEIDEKINHLKIKEYDYIENPKDDGYRSIHLIYRHNTTTMINKFYNGFLVEIQLRTKLQHLWATAVETVDLFTKQSLKSNNGEQDWRDFFKLVSSAFAIMEKTTLVPNTPSNENKLYSKINKLEKRLNVIKKMENWANLVESIPHRKGRTFFLLELNVDKQSIKVKSYSKKDMEHAIEDYASAEKNDNATDVVLVGINRIQELKKAYPNYFANTTEFLKQIKQIKNSD